MIDYAVAARVGDSQFVGTSLSFNVSEGRDPQHVPEPDSLALVGLGVLSPLGGRRRDGTSSSDGVGASVCKFSE